MFLVFVPTEHKKAHVVYILIVPEQKFEVNYLGRKKTSIAFVQTKIVIFINIKNNHWKIDNMSETKTVQLKLMWKYWVHVYLLSFLFHTFFMANRAGCMTTN